MPNSAYEWFDQLQRANEMYEGFRVKFQADDHHPLVHHWLVAVHACLKQARVNIETLRTGTNLTPKKIQRLDAELIDMIPAASQIVRLINGARINKVPLLAALSVKIKHPSTPD